MRGVIILALFAFAFLAGRWTAPEARGRVVRTSRGEIPHTEVRRAAPPHDEREPTRRASQATPKVASGAVETAGAAVEPGAPREGKGTLEIRGHRRGEGFPDLELLARDLSGRWTREIEWNLPDDDGPARVDLEPGRYRLRARHEAEPGDRLYEIAIRPYGHQVIDLAAPPGPEVYPLAEGLGRVDVQVLDVRGAPLADVEVEVIARGGELTEDTTSGGWVRFDVLPGGYAVRAGGLESRVDVRAGRTQVVRIDGRAAAEVEISGVLWQHVAVRPLDHDQPRYAIGGPRSVRHVLLKPGRYQIVCYVYQGGTHVIETITLGAGDRVRRAPAQVGVFVRFRCPVVPTGGAFGGSVHVRNSAGRASQLGAGGVVLLEPGEYTAWVDDKHSVSDPVSFRADSGEIVVEVPVRRR